MQLEENGAQITGTERNVQCNTILEFPASITKLQSGLSNLDDINLAVIRDSGFGSCAFHDRITLAREQ